MPAPPSAFDEDPQDEPEEEIVIWDVEYPILDPIRNDDVARRTMALVVVGTMCLVTLIIEVAMAVRGAPPAEMVAGAAPLATLAAATSAFYYSVKGLGERGNARKGSSPDQRTSRQRPADD